MSYDDEASAGDAALSEWLTLNRAIWPNDTMPVGKLAELLVAQVAELQAAESDYHRVEELCDIISICSRAIELRGFSVPRSMTYRLLSRHLQYAHTLPEGWK